MMLNKTIIGLLLITLTVFACRKDIDEDITTTAVINFPTQSIMGSIIGEVTDGNGNYIEGALVSVGTQTLTTNEDGFFYFQNINMNAKGTYVKVEKDDYFLGAKIFNATAGKVAYTKIELIKKVLLQSVDASLGGEITLDNKAKVILSANSIVDASGNAYTGNVNVYGAWMDPTATETLLRMPGDLRAVDSKGEFKQLATYGMIAVELEDENGNKLQIVEGSTASIKMEVPSDILANAPATIPLWHFDEENGYWIEEGEAKLEGNEYIGEVKHFSFWNCDDPFPVVLFTGNVVNVDGIPVPGALIQITVVSSGLTGTAISRYDGFFSGYIPQNELLLISIEYCGETYEQEIGPFAGDVVLDTIVISSLEDNTYIVQAKLVDCDNEPIEGGLMKIIIESEIYYALSGVDGGVNMLLLHCGSDITAGTYIAYDLENEKQTQEEGFTFNADQYAGIGTISICDELTEFIQYTLEGVEFFIPDPSITIYGTKLSLNGDNYIAANHKMHVQVTFLSLMAGTHGLDTVSVLGVLPTGVYFGGGCNSSGCSDIEGSHSGATGMPGEVVTGSFTGVVNDTMDVDGTFKVIFD